MTNNNNNNGHDPYGVPKDDDTKGVFKDETPKGVGSTYINELKGVGAPGDKEVTVTPEHENEKNESDDDDVTVSPPELDSNQIEDKLDITMDQQYGTR